MTKVSMASKTISLVDYQAFVGEHAVALFKNKAVLPKEGDVPPTGLMLGILALLLPAISVGVIWLVSLDKDYALLVYGANFAFGVSPSLVAGILALRPGVPSGRRWQARMSLLLGLLPARVYVLGGLAFFFHWGRTSPTPGPDG